MLQNISDSDNLLLRSSYVKSKVLKMSGPNFPGMWPHSSTWHTKNCTYLPVLSAAKAADRYASMYFPWTHTTIFSLGNVRAMLYTFSYMAPYVSFPFPAQILAGRIQPGNWTIKRCDSFENCQWGSFHMHPGVNLKSRLQTV